MNRENEESNGKEEKTRSREFDDFGGVELKSRFSKGDKTPSHSSLALCYHLKMVFLIQSSLSPIYQFSTDRSLSTLFLSHPLSHKKLPVNFCYIVSSINVLLISSNFSMIELWTWLLQIDFALFPKSWDWRRGRVSSSFCSAMRIDFAQESFSKLPSSIRCHWSSFGSRSWESLPRNPRMLLL